MSQLSMLANKPWVLLPNDYIDKNDFKKFHLAKEKKCKWSWTYRFRVSEYEATKNILYMQYREINIRSKRGAEYYPL